MLLNSLRQFLVGPSNPCDQFAVFSDLLASLCSTQEFRREPAVKCLYERYLKLARDEARSRRPNAIEESLDALDDVLSDLCVRLQAGTLTLASEDAMGAYIRMSIRYKLTDNYKTSKRNPLALAELLDEWQLADPGGKPPVERRLIERAVALALRQLSKDCQMKLFLWQHKYTHGEIGAVQEISPQSAKNGVFRCIQEIRERLLQYDAYKRILDDRVARNDPSAYGDEEDASPEP